MNPQSASDRSTHDSSKVAAAAEVEEAELRYEDYGLEERHDSEEESVDEPIAQIELPLPPQSGGDLRLPPPRAAAASAAANIVLRFQPLEE